MSSMLVFISSKAFNSPPKKTSASADSPCDLNQGADGGDMEHDFDDREEFVIVCLIGCNSA